MPSTYSGAWKKKATVEPQVRLVAPIDPQHLDPADDPGQPRDWRADTIVPTLPDELVGDQYLQMPILGGPIDMTPVDHAYGMGIGHGLDTYAAQDERMEWHGDDQGAVDARRYIAAGSRDGSWHVDLIPDSNNAGDSPPSVARRWLTGIEHPENDEYARRAQRQWRWRDRWIDRHMWGPEYRPSRVQNAYTAPEQPAQANGNQYTSNVPTLGWSGRGGVGSPDQFVTPQERRSPRPWDEPMTIDAIGAGNYGLTSWGL